MKKLLLVFCIGLFVISHSFATETGGRELSIPLIQSPPPVSSLGELPVPSSYQHTSVWCWAAASAMIINFYTGDRLADCQVLDAYDRSRHGQGGCCQGEPRCLVPGHELMVHDALRVFGVRSSWRATLSFKGIRLNIDDGNPMMAILRGSPIGHVVVISGYYLPDQVVVLDPANGGRSIVSYEQLRLYQGYSWQGTIATWKR